MEWYTVLLLVVVGIIAGFVNTLAGSGSLLTLPVLIFIGLPPTVANATNRIGILLQSAVASASFRQQKVFTYRESSGFIIPALAGSALGAFVAADFNEEIMRTVIGILLLFMFFILLIKPERWISGRDTSNERRSVAGRIVVFFLIGVYGGFIQAGVGFFLLAGLVYNAGVNLTKANALKVFLTFSFTLVAVIVFLFTGQIDWKVGLILGSGSIIGAWFGSRVAVSWGPVFVRIVLLIVVFVSALELTGIIRFFIKLFTG